MNDEPNPVLQIGLFLSAAHAILWIGLAMLGGLLVGLGVSAAMITEPAAMLPIGVAGGFAGLAIGIYVAWCFLTLVAVWGTYKGSRAWTWILLILSILGLMDFGLLSTPARLLTVVGIIMMLGDEKRDEAHVAR